MGTRPANFNRVIVRGATIALLHCAATAAAFAAPPLERIAHFQSPHEVLATAPHDLSAAKSPATSRLDLRLPSAERFGSTAGVGERSMFTRRASTDTEDSRLRDLDAAYTNGMKAETMQSMVRRVRREGLPVARLWENKSALVSLGLNGRGKPGIWLVQKIH